MEHAEILKPVVALAAWTMLMWAWMYITRIPAMQKAEGLDVNNMVGGVGGDLDKVYAVALVLAITGWGDGMNATIAWAYVGLRIAHSLVQALWNRIMVRFTLFLLSSLALIALIVHAAMVVFH